MDDLKGWQYPLPTKEEFKAKAQELKKLHNMKSSHAHEVYARSLGFNSKNHYLAELKKCNQ